MPISLTVMDTDFNKLAEIAQFTSWRFTRSYWGVGEFELNVHPQTPGVSEILPDRMIYPNGAPHKAYICEEVKYTRDKITVKGVQLKGLAKRRVCVPPLTLPGEMWRYTNSAWTKVTDQVQIRNAMKGDVYQGFKHPENPTNGQWFLDISALGTVYDWGTEYPTSNSLPDYDALQVARLRKQYSNFGWDRFTGSAEAAYLHFAQNNLISPEDSDRAIPWLNAAESQNRGLVLPWQARFDKLDSLFEKIGEATGIGWDITLDIHNRQMIFGAVVGRDYSAGSTVALISEEMGNASAITRTDSRTGSACTVYVGGAGEDENRLILSVGDGAGAERREMWAEAGGVEDVEMLRLFGRNKLDGVGVKNTLTATLIDSGACRYERDYDIGDKVLVRGAGGEMAAQITQITETHENGKRTLAAVFGDAPVTIARALGRGGSAAR